MRGHRRSQVFRGTSPERSACEAALLDRWGGLLPIYARSAWAGVVGERASALIALSDEQGRWRSGAGLTFVKTRAVPGCYWIHLHRAGSGVADSDVEPLVMAARNLAARLRGALGLRFEVFSRLEPVRAGFASALLAHGFYPAEELTAYARTIAVRLDPDDDRLLRSFSEQARRHIRHQARHPIRVEAITDPAYVPALQQMLENAFKRTGGTPPLLPWDRILAVARAHPELLRVSGTFRADRHDPGGLLSFAFGCMHGDHAHYDAAGSERPPDLKAPLGYGPVWDLMQWSRALGATWFDFGGVTAGRDDASDPLAGISDFKRGFSDEMVRVHDEWIYEPHPLLTRTADATRLLTRVARLGLGAIGLYQA